MLFSCILLLTGSAIPATKWKSYRLWVTATAYCPCEECCGRFADGKTYTGRDANTAGVAVDRSVIPLGARLDIPGYRRGPNKNGSWILADDIGSRIVGWRIDVRFRSHEEAKRWGVKRIRIRIWRKK